MTLEEYAVAKLQEKDQKIAEGDEVIDKLMHRIDELESEIDYQRKCRERFSKMFKVVQYRDPKDGYYINFECGSSNSYSEERREEFLEAMNYLGLKLPEMEVPDIES